MIAALLYKEYREHRSIWLALAVVAAGVLVGVPAVFKVEMQQHGLFAEMLYATSMVFAWTYGVVCGAMLLAGEKEGGTEEFLDTLPSARLSLWRGKVLAGGLFLLLHVLLLIILVGVQGFLFPEHHLVEAIVALVGAGVAGFGWGLVFSAVAKNVLSAIGMAVIVQLGILPFFYALVLALWLAGRVLGLPSPEYVALTLGGLVLLLAPLPLSALIYSRVDRERQPWRYSGPVFGWWRDSRHVWWLAWRQMRGILFGLFLFSLVAGVGVIGNGLFVWPVVTVCIGAFCGVAVFLDEQSGGRRFLGDQRFPPGRIWTVKVVLWLAILLLAVLVVLFPGLVAQVVWFVNASHNHARGSFLARLFGSELIGLTIPPGTFLFLFPIYGFAVGCVCGMLCRKPLVALVTGVGLAMLLVSVWIPSLLVGGLRGWQTAGPPVVLFVCARWLMRPWLSDRLLSRAAVCCCVAAVLLSAGLTALGLWYRVAAIPDVAEPEDFPAFVASLPAPEENQAGELIRRACSRLGDLSKRWPRVQPGKAFRPGDPPAPDTDFLGQIDAVSGRGWPDAAPELSAWLDGVFADDWWKKLAEASHKPTGVVEDPRRLTIQSELRFVQPARLAGLLLAARGLQMQKVKGDSAVFVDHFAIALALVRNLLHDSPQIAALVAVQIEAKQLLALERWLEQLNGRPDLLRRAGAVLARHVAALPPDFREQRMAEYLILLNTCAQPQVWLLASLSGIAPQSRDHAPALLEEALMTPWEKARLSRLLRVGYWDPDAARAIDEDEFVLLSLVRVMSTSVVSLDQKWPRRQVRLAAAELMVGLRLFQAETGKPAESLNQLTPKYLKRIPEDPFDHKPFRYRLSQGEEIVWPDENIGPIGPPVAPGGGWGPGPAPGGAAPAPPGGAVMPPAAPAGPGVLPPGGMAEEPKRKVPAGQGILWSVGEDGRDDGGKRQGLTPGIDRTRRGEDLIFLVPLPVAKRR